MSTLGQPNLEASWKEEVNRRIAAHKSRKGGVDQPTGPEPAAAMNSRAAEAAARVAARYAKAPTYSQMQAEEARVAVRAAQIATKVALEAQAVAESAIAELHAATKPARRSAVIESIARTAVVEAPILPFVEEPVPPVMMPAVLQSEEVSSIPSALTQLETESLELANAPAEAESVTTAPGIDAFSPIAEAEVVAEPISYPAVEAGPVVYDRESLTVRWDADLPSRTIELPVAAAPPRPQEDFAFAAEDWWTPAQVSDTLRNEPLEVNAVSAHANLIQFPRELVATRKMRPRIAEAQAAHTADRQLSIFEVDPDTVLTTPEAEVATPREESTYSGPEWSGMELGEHPERQPILLSATAAQEPGFDVAPFSRRLMTWVVDGALILGAFFLAAMYAVSHMAHVPAPKPAEMMGAAGLVLIALFYQALFFSCGLSTPGMRYAGLALSTFDDELASAAQTRRRLAATLLSMAPFGLGLVWAVFDEDHLSWHDRFSGTYLRKKV